jgi:hypothetical protein
MSFNHQIRKSRNLPTKKKIELLLFPTKERLLSFGLFLRNGEMQFLKPRKRKKLKPTGPNLTMNESKRQ